MYHILAIDDDLQFLNNLSSILQYQKYRCRTVNNPFKAMELLQKEDFDSVLLDVQMPGIDGLSLLEQIKKQFPALPVIMVSGKSTLAVAVKAIKQGAFDFIEKGGDLDRLLITLKNAISQHSWLQERNMLVNELLENYQMVGQSQAMQKIFNQIDFVAPTDSKVLITGETGTGKELVARAIQLKSKRSTKPFVRVNCAAVPEALVESTFFGHKKGSFTGALRDHAGKFETADGGTIFLDEIGELSPQAQAKLLNVLQNGEIEKVGGQEPKIVDVRVIAATNKNLPELVQQGKFRQDLYHRLNVFHIHVPPLRERLEDIPLLVDHFLKHFSAEAQKDVVSVSNAGMNILLEYDWPGNVRMLRNVINRAVMFSNERIISAEEISLALDMDRTQPNNYRPALTLSEYLEIQERQYLQRMLQICNGNKQEIARMIGIDRATLWRKLKKYNLSQEE